MKKSWLIAELGEFLDDGAYQIVRRRSAGGEADGDGARRQPVGCRHLRLRINRPVTNLVAGDQALGMGDVERRPRRRADPRQVTRVAAVVPSDDKGQVYRF